MRSSHEILFKCPFCSHHKKKLSVNVATFQWKCWVCNRSGGSLFTLFWNLRDPVALAAYKQEFPKHYQPETEEIDQSFRLSLPDEYEPLFKAKSFFARRSLSYLKQRDITDQHILKHKIGHATHGKYANRVIFPSFDEDGGLNFFTGRTTRTDQLKYLNPKTPKGYKNTIIFNELNVDWTQPVHLVEGFVDMLKVGDNTIPLFGSTLRESSKLFLNLVMHECKVYVCLDSDAIRKQLQMLRSLFSYGVECFGVDVAPYNDVGEMPTEAFLERKERSMKASQHSMFMKKLEVMV